MGFKPSKKLTKKHKRGLWSPEEDQRLKDYILQHGIGCWTSVPLNAGLQRNGKSCRLRWINYLRPGLKRDMFSTQEEDIILNFHQTLGNNCGVCMHLRSKHGELIPVDLEIVRSSRRSRKLFLTHKNQNIMVGQDGEGDGVPRNNEIPENDGTPNPPPRRLFRDFGNPSGYESSGAIRLPTTATNFVINPHYSKMVMENQFSGLPSECPLEHLDTFIDICQMVSTNLVCK